MVGHKVKPHGRWAKKEEPVKVAEKKVDKPKKGLFKKKE